eukprot:CAMPEP_0172728516 /NCGR_PEP_ID=MMETSP1074-20121228/92283_1 /TAXON_ID=2916 /ORGANISM="Ceratium fusus, Strain PA161109" /LENGTH=213 /DNA_ID=CAMNT_0013555773 /DNA_START=889 /DNA_END=1531 /DNA_ORIENTATION=-
MPPVRGASAQVPTAQVECCSNIGYSKDLGAISILGQGRYFTIHADLPLFTQINWVRTCQHRDGAVPPTCDDAGANIREEASNGHDTSRTHWHHLLHDSALHEHHCNVTSGSARKKVLSVYGESHASEFPNLPASRGHRVSSESTMSIVKVPEHNCFATAGCDKVFVRVPPLDVSDKATSNHADGWLWVDGSPCCNEKPRCVVDKNPLVEHVTA